MGTIAKFLSSLIPESFLLKLVKLVTRFPDYAARTTTNFIKSPMGVRQALHVVSPQTSKSPLTGSYRHLAKDEMTTITDDKWDQKVWGAATSEGTNERDTANSNLVFYWGKKVWYSTHVRPESMDSDRILGQMGGQSYQRRID